jgi:hypothetical protein
MGLPVKYLSRARHLILHFRNEIRVGEHTVCPEAAARRRLRMGILKYWISVINDLNGDATMESTEAVETKRKDLRFWQEINDAFA